MFLDRIIKFAVGWQFLQDLRVHLHVPIVLAVVPATETPTPTALLPGFQFQPLLENQLVVQTTVQS